VLFTGTFGTGTIPATGAGTRFMWYPKKAALRVGQVVLTGSAWDDTNIGNYSVAMGRNVQASGLCSFAFGEGAYALGDYSIGLGGNAYDAHGIAVGDGAHAYGEYAASVGLAYADGEGATAVGGSGGAMALGATSIGAGSANGEFSTSINWGLAEA